MENLSILEKDKIIERKPEGAASAEAENKAKVPDDQTFKKYLANMDTVMRKRKLKVQAAT